MKFEYPIGATPIDESEADGLIPSHITLKKELDEYETVNIAQARVWAFSRKKSGWLSTRYIQQVHKKMLEGVWKWAGSFRKTNKNIGIDWPLISIELKNLCDDTQYWLKHQTFENSELYARFHHRLVSIHPFPNGNGRHARLMTEIMAFQTETSIKLTWGSTRKETSQSIRKEYKKSLQAADKDDYNHLIAFIVS